MGSVKTEKPWAEFVVHRFECYCGFWVSAISFENKVLYLVDHIRAAHALELAKK